MTRPGGRGQWGQHSHSSSVGGEGCCLSKGASRSVNRLCSRQSTRRSAAPLRPPASLGGAAEHLQNDPLALGGRAGRGAPGQPPGLGGEAPARNILLLGGWSRSGGSHKVAQQSRCSQFPPLWLRPGRSPFLQGQPQAPAPALGLCRGGAGSPAGQSPRLPGPPTASLAGQGPFLLGGSPPAVCCPGQ